MRTQHRGGVEHCTRIRVNQTARNGVRRATQNVIGISFTASARNRREYAATNKNVSKTIFSKLHGTAKLKKYGRGGHMQTTITTDTKLTQTQAEILITFMIQKLLILKVV